MSVAGAPTLQDLAGLALRVLAREGAVVDVVGNTGEPGWRCVVGGAGGTDGRPPLDISLAGPDIPDTVSDGIAPPALIAGERPWKGRYRLAIRAPLLVFDLYWTPGEPLRIMSFSRGDWESDLAAAVSVTV